MKALVKRATWVIGFVALCAFGSAQSQTIVLGNPSGAQNDSSLPDNYLVLHSGYILSYNRDRGAPNWVTWHLSGSDIGSVDRTNAFAADILLPADWRIGKNDYAGSGYDRGHMCPSEDRSQTEVSNRESFLMSNMQPQLHRLNGGTWKSLDGYVKLRLANSRFCAVRGTIGINDEVFLGHTTTAVIALAGRNFDGHSALCHRLKLTNGSA